jgi:hypothetical protein
VSSVTVLNITKSGCITTAISRLAYSPKVGIISDGELYFREWYRNDFSRESHPFQHIFIHELSHIWQRNRGMYVRVNGLISGLVSYRYHLNGRPLRRYSME